MQKLDLDYTGRPAKNLPKNGLWSTGGIISSIIKFWIGLNVLVFLGIFIKLKSGTGVSVADILSVAMINGGMMTYTFIAVSSTRANLREKYLIGTERCSEMEDGLLTTFCMPCAVSQMARHVDTGYAY